MTLLAGPHQREKLIEKKCENQVSVCWRGVVVVTRESSVECCVECCVIMNGAERRGARSET